MVIAAVPLVLGALGGVIGERSGVVNVAIEGQLLFGGFMTALVGTATAQPVDRRDRRRAWPAR